MAETQEVEEKQEVVENKKSTRTLVFTTQSENGNGQEWLALYADLITTVMIFFVLLFSMSSLDAGKYQKLKNALKENLVKGKTENQVEVIEDDFAEIEAVLNSYIKQESIEDYVLIDKTPHQISIVVNAPIFFKSGDSDLLPSAHKFLDIIIKTLKPFKFKVMVDGHTDDIPINTRRYRNNWELSTLRATEVVSFLIEKGGISPTRLTAAGYSKYRPIAPNDSKKNRARNRRVEIKIIK